MLILLNLFDFLKMVRKLLGCILSVNPLLRLLDYFTNHIVLDHLFYVYAVVHFLKNATGKSVFDFDIVQELEPEVFKLVSIILEQVEVVSNC